MTFVAAITENGKLRGVTEAQYASRIHALRRKETCGFFPRSPRRTDPKSGLEGWRKENINRALKAVTDCGPATARQVSVMIGLAEGTTSDYLRVLFVDGRITRSRKRGDGAFFYEVAK